ncbi:MAG: NAD(+) diphosphatase [Gammaproteobacteria bacterium]
MDHFSRSSLNCFAALQLDRAALKRRDPGWLQARLSDASTVLVPLWRSRNLLRDQQPVYLNPADVELSSAHSICLLGERDGQAFVVVDLEAADDSVGDELARFGEFLELRGAAPLLSEHDAALLAYARAMTYWHRRNRFCGDCGSPTRSTEAGFIRECCNDACARKHFPRTDPAIIVLVTDAERCLLGRQAQWPAGVYSSLAGFVEPGESLEDAVIREVEEESGVVVSRVHYHSSQPWPFPGSIMLGFTAEAQTTGLTFHDEELEDARWFSRDRLTAELASGRVKVPTRVSIAYRLLEDWFDRDDTGALKRILNEQ